jgi:hypothetical protein
MSSVQTAARRPARAPQLSARLSAELAAIAAAIAFYAVFIGRSAFSFEGRTFFALADDPMISMRYGRNLAEGAGLTWTGGQHVEGYSNFLWTLWMGLVHLLPIPESKTSLAIMVTGAALLVGTMLAVRSICLELAPDRPILGVVAMVLTGFFYPLVYWSLRGYEVGLVAFLVAAMVLLALRLQRAPTARTAWTLSGVLALAVLTRDELVLPCLLVVAFCAWTAPSPARRRALAVVAGPMLLVFAAHAAYRLAYYGSTLPNTYYLKLGGASIGDRLDRGGIALAHSWLFTLYAPLLLAIAYLAARRRARPRGVVLIAGIVLVHAGYSLYVGGDFLEQLGFANRYIAPAAPLLMVMAALGIGEIAFGGARRLGLWLGGAFVAAAAVISYDWLPIERLRLAPEDGLHYRMVLVAVGGAALVVALSRWRLPAAIAASALAALVLVQVNAKPVQGWERGNAQGLDHDTYLARSGLIVHDQTPPGTTIGVIAAGNTAYFAERPMVDMLGKMDPVIAHERPRAPFAPGHDKWDYDYSIGRLRPDVVILVWPATRAELCRIRSWGYVHPGGEELFVRGGVRGVDTRGLARGILGLHPGPSWPWRFPDANCA